MTPRTYMGVVIEPVWGSARHYYGRRWTAEVPNRGRVWARSLADMKAEIRFGRELDGAATAAMERTDAR